MLGIIASGYLDPERILRDCELWLDANSHDGSDTWANLGTGGSALNARLGSASGADTNDPLWLQTDATNGYVYLPGGSNSISCTAPASAASYSAVPLSGSPSTGAATGGAAFSFSTSGSWKSISLLNGSAVEVARFDLTAGTNGGATGQTDSYGVVWTINRATSGRKTVVVPAALYGGRSKFLFGTDDYTQNADDNLLDFGATDSFTILWIGRQWATPISYGNYVSKLSGTTNPRWSLGADNTNLRPLAFVSDGTNSAQVNGASFTAGAQVMVGMVVDRASQTLRAVSGSTLSSTVSVASVGSLSNSDVMRLMRWSTGTYQDAEVRGAVIKRSAMGTAELEAIRNYYGAAA